LSSRTIRTPHNFYIKDYNNGSLWKAIQSKLISFKNIESIKLRLHT
jgi:hypothetical protein